MQDLMVAMWTNPENDPQRSHLLPNYNHQTESQFQSLGRIFRNCVCDMPFCNLLMSIRCRKIFRPIEPPLHRRTSWSVSTKSRCICMTRPDRTLRGQPSGRPAGEDAFAQAMAPAMAELSTCLVANTSRPSGSGPT